MRPPHWCRRIYPATTGPVGRNVDMTVETAAALGPHGSGTGGDGSRAVARARNHRSLAHRTDGILRAVEHSTGRDLPTSSSYSAMPDTVPNRLSRDRLRVRRRNSDLNPNITVIKWRRRVSVTVNDVRSGRRIGGKCPSWFSDRSKGSDRGRY